VTGIFLFADKSGGVFAYECGYCGCVMREPGDLGEKDFVATTNNYNSADMIPYNLPAEWFSDTYFRYATIVKKLSMAPGGTLGFDFAKAAWLSNNWYDAATDTWSTVPVPNDPSDFNTCNVPGNQCEGGESQVVQFPAQKTTHLQSGGPHGTAIQYYWPDDPKPTGEYTKWQLHDSIEKLTAAASDDARKMIKAAQDSFAHNVRTLDKDTQASLRDLLNQATQAWSKGRSKEASASGGKGDRQTADMAQWGAACTDYATAQLYAQMVSTKLKGITR
jgi:hypothetical protein